MTGFIVKVYGFLITALLFFRCIDAVCERSSQMLAAEDICWTNKVKIADRIQYTTKSVLNFAKKTLGLDAEDPYVPQQCDYYECIFGELKMLTGNGYPNYDKMVEWIDNNIIYVHAKALYERLTKCNSALSKSVESNLYFFGDPSEDHRSETPELQNKCEILKEFMKCLAIDETDCIIFKYP